MLISVCFWVYYYYIKRDLYEEKEWKIITFVKKEKYAFFLFLMFINLIIFILICVLLSKKEYNNGYFKAIEDNWNKSPIYSIEVSNSFSDEYQFGNFPGTKNLAYGGTTKSRKITSWNSYKFSVERKDKKYKNFLNGVKQCGFDSYGNKLYVDFEEECPINYIEITNQSFPSLQPYSFTTKNIGDKYLHYTKEYITGKVLIDFKISDMLPSLNLDLDKCICKFIDGRCELNKKDLYYNITENDEEIFNKIDSIKLSHLLNDNDIEINDDSYDFTKDINLYTQTYIGSSKYTNNVLSIYRFSKAKNIVLLIFTLIFICFCFTIFDFFNQKFGIYGFIAFVLVYVLIFINFILSVVAVAKYNTITNKTFKELNNSISKEFKNKKWNYKINCVLILLF